MIREIKNNDMAAVEQSALAVVDFNASWCGPCKMLAPVLSKVSDEMSDIDFFGVDVDENPMVSMNYGIQSVPTLIFFENGLAVDKMIGFTPEQELLEWIKGNR